MDALIVGCVGGGNAEEIVELTAHQMAFENFGDALDRLLEALEGLLGLGRERYLDEELVGEPEAGTVEVVNRDLRLTCEPVPAHLMAMVRDGGLVPHLKKQIGELDPRTGEGVIEPGDFTVDEKSHQIYLTEDGHENAERLLSAAGLLAEGASLYDPANITLMHHVYAALRARNLFHRDQHYVVQDGDVMNILFNV